MKVNTMLRFVSLPAVLIVTMCLSQEVRADPVTFAVTSVTLTPSPAMINCGSSLGFTLVLKGVGAGELIGQNLLWSVFQDETVDDELIGETTFTVFGDGTPAGNWEEIITFTLECTADCILRGRSGSSSDQQALVYALIEFPFGSDAGRSTNIEVKCVPEPASMLLLSTGIAGAIGAARRKRKRS